MFRHHFFHFVIVREKYLNPDSICHICPPDQTICFRKQPPGVQSKNTGSRIDPANHSSQHLVFNPQTRRQSNMSLVFFQKIIPVSYTHLSKEQGVTSTAGWIVLTFILPFRFTTILCPGINSFTSVTGKSKTV